MLRPCLVAKTQGDQAFGRCRYVLPRVPDDLAAEIPIPSDVVGSLRKCSRSACTRPAVTTLTYVYADSTAVLGPLATYAEPHSYDLCSEHAERLTVPRGWEVIRLAPDPESLRPSHDDLEALANAVREAAKPRETTSEPAAGTGTGVGRRGHLRVLRNPDL